jgi:hypothetical protein
LFARVNGEIRTVLYDNAGRGFYRPIKCPQAFLLPVYVRVFVVPRLVAPEPGIMKRLIEKTCCEWLACARIMAIRRLEG